jgi:hypothetical protein
MDDDFGSSSIGSYCVAGRYHMGGKIGRGSSGDYRSRPRFTERTSGERVRLYSTWHRPELTVAKRRRRAR